MPLTRLNTGTWRVNLNMQRAPWIVTICVISVKRIYMINMSYSLFISNSTGSWWRHQMEAFSALLAICAGNSPVPGEFPTQRPVTRSFDVFFDLRPNKRLSKQWRGWWFETQSCSLWRHCNDDCENAAHGTPNLFCPGRLKITQAVTRIQNWKTLIMSSWPRDNLYVFELDRRWFLIWFIKKLIWDKSIPIYFDRHVIIFLSVTVTGNPITCYHMWMLNIFYISLYVMDRLEEIQGLDSMGVGWEVMFY